MPGPPLSCDALVLGLVNYGERDRIVRLLTPDRGRIAAMARGARGSRKRFSGVDLGARLRLTLRPGHGELWYLQEAELADPRLGLREGLLPMALAAYGCEFVGAFARESHPEPRLFGLLEVFLTLLDAATAPPGRMLRLGLEVKALTCAGLAPVLASCAICGEPLEERSCFSGSTGGAVHPECGPGELVDTAFVAALERARNTPSPQLLDQQPPPGPNWLLARFAEHHLGRALKSRDWLATLE